MDWQWYDEAGGGKWAGNFLLPPTNEQPSYQKTAASFGAD